MRRILCVDAALVSLSSAPLGAHGLGAGVVGYLFGAPLGGLLGSRAQ